MRKIEQKLPPRYLTNSTIGTDFTNTQNVTTKIPKQIESIFVCLSDNVSYLVQVPLQTTGPNGGG